MRHDLSTARSRLRIGLLAAALIAAAGAAHAGDVRLRHSIGGVCPDCDFSGRNLEDAPVVGNLPRADFSGAILRRAQLSGHFADASFARADLTEATLQGGNFTGADFAGAKLESARISGANFFGADFTGAGLRNAEAAVSRFENVSFLGARLNGARLDGATLSRSVFTGAELTGASLVNARFDQARFEDADLQNADLSGARAVGASFARTNLTQTILEGADFSAADLSEAIGLSAEALSSACGDARTRLPAGLGLEDCASRGELRASRAGPAWNGRAPLVGATRDGTPRHATSDVLRFLDKTAASRAEAGARADADTLRQLAERLRAANDALASAHAASHAELNLDVRDSIRRARAALAELEAPDLVNSDTQLLAVAEAIEQARRITASARVREPLEDAAAEMERAVAGMVEVRAALQGEIPLGFIGTVEDERARRLDRLERVLEARDRQLEREFDARLRALEADCADDLAAAEPDAYDPLRASCTEREAALIAEREQRRAGLLETIAAERAHSLAELSEIEHQLNMIDERYE